MLTNEDYKRILFSLVFRLLKRKNLIGEFVKNSLEYHSIRRHEYDLPENLSTKDKVKFVIEHNVSAYIGRNPNFKYGVDFESKMQNFFTTYEGSFSWIDTGDENKWHELSKEWYKIYLPMEINKLIKTGVKLL